MLARTFSQISIAENDQTSENSILPSRVQKSRKHKIDLDDDNLSEDL